MFCTDSQRLLIENNKAMIPLSTGK